MPVLFARKLAVPLIGLVLLACGCGGGGKLTGSRSTGPADTSAAQVASYLASVDPLTGQITFRTEQTGMGAQSTSYGGGDDLTLSGAAAYNNATAILSGNVTVSTTNVVDYYDLRVVVADISNSNVTVTNASGLTTLIPNRNSPFWSYGRVNQSLPVTRNWQFRDPGGVSFTFRVQVWANAWKYSAGDGGALQGLSFVSRTRGWAAGAGGKILTTTDGATWTPQVTGIGQHLFDVCFVDTSYGWAVGAAGAIVATTNGGRTWRTQAWQTQPEEVNVTLTAVRFVNRTTGWAVGTEGTVLRTTNGGQTWSRSALESGEALYDVASSGTSQVWVVGTGSSVFHSSDGGANWSPQTFPVANQLASLTGVAFVDNNRGIAVGTFGTAFRTTNGGQTWTSIDCGVGALNLQDVDFVSANLVFVAGQLGSIRRSTDGGVNWDYIDSGTSNNLVAIDCVDSAYGWAVGTDGTLVRTMTASDPSGAGWGLQLRSTLNSLNAVDFLNDTTGVAVGRSGAVMITNDGGNSWQAIAAPAVTTLTGVKLQSVSGNTRIWVVGAGGILAYSDNAGGSWVSRTPSDVSTANTFSDIDFTSATLGLVVGSNGIILRTTNGGSTWAQRGSGVTTQSLNAVAFASATIAWAVGSFGVVLYTDDGGNTWTGVGSPVGDSLFDVAAVDATHMWMCGQNGRIASFAGWGPLGANWTVQDSSSIATLNGIDFVDSQRGWAVGTTGALLHTEDGGASWLPAVSGTTVTINDILFRNPDDAWAVGSTGFIQRFH
jgi:photosystem II stability/assembly factor-like uncharacterized protein